MTEVTVSANEPSAQVMVGSQLLGTTPLPEPVLLEAGQITLRITKEGYCAFERLVTFVRWRQRNVRYSNGLRWQQYPKANR